MNTVNYADVVSGKVRPINHGPFLTTQYVGWDGVPEYIATHYFRTIGRYSFPKPPELPKGFQMATHPLWVNVVREIKKDVSIASFEKLDMMQLDLHDFSEMIGDSYGDDLIPYDDRRDWVNWSCSFDDAWGDLAIDLERLFHFSNPHKPPHSNRMAISQYMAKNGLTGELLGNRHNPPSLARTLQIMLDNVLLYEAQKLHGDQ